MAIDLVNAGTYEASAASIWYPNYPSSVDTGQFLVMQLTVRNTTTTPTVSASWVLMYGPDSDSVSRQFLYYRFGTTTMSASSTTVRGGVTTVTKQGRIYGFSGISATSAYESGEYMTSSTASMTCGEVTATWASFTCLGVAAYHVADDNNVSTFAGAGGASWTWKYQGSTTLGSDGTIGIEVATISAPPVTVTTASYSMSASDPWGVRTLLLVGSATIPAVTALNQWYLYQFNLASA